MAREAITIVGTVVGAYFGNPQLGYAIGSLIGNAVDPVHIKGPRLNEVPSQTSSEGGYRQVVYGVCWINTTNIIDFGDIVRRKTETQQGKGGGPVVEGERILRTYAIGLGEPVAGIRVVRRNGVIVYDTRPGSTMLAESAKFGQRFTFLSGAEDQMPHPALEALPRNGVGNTPAHRGTALMVFELDDLTEERGQVPVYEVEAVQAGTVVPGVETPMVDYAGDGINGGTTAGWIHVYQRYLDVRAFTGFLAELEDPTSGPVYVRVIAPEVAGGQVLWDSGWMGDEADQSELTAALAATTIIRLSDPVGPGHVDVTDPTEIGLFRLNLNGAIQGVDPVSGTFVPPFGIGEGSIVQVIRPGGVNPGSVGGEWTAYEPDPTILTEPYVALPDVYGVLMGLETGTPYFTPYATAIDTVDPDTVYLYEVLADIADRCGIPASKVDFTDLTDTLDGITMGGPYDGAGAITMLMPAYFFDLYEADKKIRAVKRGAAVKDTITADDLIEAPDENTLRGQDIEYPRALMLKYLNPGQNYAAPAAVVSRTTPDIRVSGNATAELPISMDETTAKRVADRMLKVMWEDLNGEVTFSLPSGPFAWLTPTDCLGLSLNGALYRLRVEKVTEVAYTLQIVARRDRQSAYTSTLTASPLPAPTAPPATLAGPTVLKVTNAPGRIDSDDRVGVLVFFGAVMPGWYGAALQYSADDGATWISLGSHFTRAAMGQLTAPLPYASRYLSDWINTVQVQMFDSRDLESVTQVHLFHEGNGAAIIKPDNTLEVLQFETATDDGSNHWTLGNRLVRGRLATTPATHLVGSTFVTLESGVFVELPTSRLGQPLLFRAASLGTSMELATVVPFTWSPAVVQTEFPQPHLRATREGGSLDVSWLARHRFGTELNPIASAKFDGWRVTATDGATTSVVTVPRGALPEVAIPDTFSGPVDVTVQPLNAITGAGPSTSRTGVT